MFIVEKHITLDTLKKALFTLEKLVQARTLYQYVELVQHNVKKAMAIAYHFCHFATGDKDCTLPSGTGFANLYVHILDKMYLLLTKEGNDVEDSKDEAKSEKVPKESMEMKKRPEECFFPGYFLFVIFTKFQDDPNRCLNLFKSNNNNQSFKEGHKMIHKEAEVKQEKNLLLKTKREECPLRTTYMLRQSHKGKKPKH